MNKHDYDDAYEKELRAVGIAVSRLAALADSADDEQVAIDSIRANLHADNDTSVLLVIKGHKGSRQLITFVGGLTLPTALLAAAKKAAAGALRWREDRPWKE